MSDKTELVQLLKKQLDWNWTKAPNVPSPEEVLADVAQAILDDGFQKRPQTTAMQLHGKIADAIDADVRLLILASGVTLDQFNEHLGGIKGALAGKALYAVKESGIPLAPDPTTEKPLTANQRVAEGDI